MIATFFLLISVMSWWVRTYRRAEELGHGQARLLGVPSAIWLFLVLGLFRPILMGRWSEMVPYGIFPHLDWTAAFSIRYGNLSTTRSTPLDRVPLRLGAALRDARGDDPRRQPLRRRPRIEQIVDRGTALGRPRCSGAGRWVSTRRWRASTAGPGGSRCSTPITGGIGILLTGTVVDNWFLWAQEHHFAPMYDGSYGYQSYSSGN